MHNVDFDDYCETYDSLINNHLAGYGDIDYLGKSKVKLVREILGNFNEHPNILDFGCGVGRNLPYLKSFYPEAKIHAFDISKNSLDYAKQNNPDITTIYENSIDSYISFFDLIFISGVFHHIEEEQRIDVVKRLKRLLNDHGTITVFEHNPLNPVTRSIVKDCPFDKDAKLVTKNKLNNLFIEQGFKKLSHRYTLFVPPKLKAFDFIEKFLYRVPLGAQYCVFFTK